MSLTISDKAPGKAWLVADQTNALHFEVRLVAESGLLEFSRLSPVMQLKDQGAGKRSYLDIACESKGYIYVLSYGNSGSSHPTTGWTSIIPMERPLPRTNTPTTGRSMQRNYRGPVAKRIHPEL